MGISGLLKILEEQTEKKHLKTYEGKRVAVDAYAWIHKALYMMKSEIFENPKSKK